MWRSSKIRYCFSAESIWPRARVAGSQLSRIAVAASLTAARRWMENRPRPAVQHSTSANARVILLRMLIWVDRRRMKFPALG